MIDHYHAVQEVAYPGFGEGGCLIIILYLYNHTHYLLTTTNLILLLLLLLLLQSKFKQRLCIMQLFSELV